MQQISTDLIRIELHDALVRSFEADSASHRLIFDVEYSCDHDAEELFCRAWLTFFDIEIVESNLLLPLNWNQIAYGAILDSAYLSDLDEEGREGVCWTMELIYQNSHQDMLVMKFRASHFTWEVYEQNLTYP